MAHKDRRGKQPDGTPNYAAYLAVHPERGNFKHGGASVNFRKRFSDRRTNEGKRLAMIIKAIVDDLGGPKELSAPQRVLVDVSIRPKLITMLSIGQYIDKQTSIISEDGTLLKCLSQNYLAFSNSLRLDLVTLVRSSQGPFRPSHDGGGVSAVPCLHGARKVSRWRVQGAVGHCGQKGREELHRCCGRCVPDALSQVRAAPGPWRSRDHPGHRF